MLCEGVGIRAIERLTQLNRRTVLGILQTAGEKCARLLDDRLKNLKVQDVEIDELYSFVHCLQQNTTADDTQRGDQYTFLATERNTKLIVHHLVGKREGHNAFKFLRGLKSRIDGRFQLTSDEYSPYCGPLSAVSRVFQESVDYGTERKRLASEPFPPIGKISRRDNPVKCLWVKRTSRIGAPDRSRMTVNHAERANLSVRLFNRRFTRKTLGYSKTLENHKHSVALMITHFNFCRVHSALKIDATDTQPAQQRTPAMAAGLTDHVWTVAELLSP
jgi:IS1 family transposase